MTETRTYVTFQSSAFNTTETGADYINPDNFGDDLAQWVMERLREQSVVVAPELGQEDLGWYITFEVAGQSYNFILGYRYGEESNWLGWLERDVGLLPSVFGARRRSIMPEGAQAIHRALTSSSDIQNVRWHFKQDFDAGDEEHGNTQPTAA